MPLGSKAEVVFKDELPKIVERWENYIKKVEGNDEAVKLALLMQQLKLSRKSSSPSKLA